MASVVTMRIVYFVCMCAALTAPCQGSWVSDLLERVGTHQLHALDNKPLNVSMNFKLTNIVSADENTNEVTLTAWLGLEWNVPYASWENGPEQLSPPAAAVWTPDIVPYALTKPVEDLIPQTLVVTREGTFYSVAPLRMTIPCDVRKVNSMFDSDGATCRMKWGSWTHDGNAINLVSKDSGPLINPVGNVDVTEYFGHSKYYITSANMTKATEYYTCCPDQPFPNVYIKIEFKSSGL